MNSKKINKNFVCIAIMGGIGDQIFQFCYANYLQKKYKCIGYLDISYYKSRSNYNNFILRLKNLAQKNNFRLANNIPKVSYKFVSKLRFFELFKINIILPSIYNFFFNIPVQSFIYEYWKKNNKINSKKNSYYFGYWHNFNYVKKIKKNINKNLINPELKKVKLNKFIKKVSKKTVAIHVRGGDFKSLNSHNILSDKYYNEAINFYKKLLKNPKFHIFTNDIKLSKKIISNKESVIFLKKYNFSDIEEFSLFSKYKYAIIANSTFSLMSSYLSSTRLISVAPKIWLKGKRLEKNKKFSTLKFI